MTLQAIKFDKSAVTLEILDQLQIPHATHYIAINSISDAYDAIKKMQVRGAPAIAIVGAFSITVASKKYVGSKTVGELVEEINHLVTSRPTAVNLLNACTEIKELLSKFPANQKVSEEVFSAIFDYSVALYEDDLSNNFKIGDNGVDYIVETLQKQNFSGPFSIMTICNTGSLATSGHGTALGIVRSAHKKLTHADSSAERPFWLDRVYPLETRPYNQGAKLTSYELDYEKIPFTLICDSMASSLVSTLSKSSVKDSSAPVKFIIVGADRVVKNGDTANKIGTFQLATIKTAFNAILPVEKHISFIVAAPRTTIDLNTAVGDDIIIEERPANELTSIKSQSQTLDIAPPGISVWNPAFDVTPNALVDSIVTEEKVHVKENGEFNLIK